MEALQRVHLDARLPRNTDQAFPVILSVFSLFVAIPGSGSAQNLSIGIPGGGSITDAFPTQNLGDTRTFSSSKDYLIGPALE